jgi:hypothetical protein
VRSPVAMLREAADTEAVPSLNALPSCGGGLWGLP